MQYLNYLLIIIYIRTITNYKIVKDDKNTF